MSQPKDYSAIMLSSTFTDLKEHRQKAIDVISRLDLKPKVMEHSGAQADTDVIHTSLKMVRDAAAYVGIISRKYGQTPRDPLRNPNGLSITELEFNEAMALGRPILLFIMSDQHPLIEADVEIDPEKRTKLAAFRERAKRTHSNSEVHRIYEVFDSLERFSTSAAIAIADLVRHLPVRGKPGPTIDNVPIREPRNFLGRDDDLAAIDTAFKSGSGRAAVSALHGLRGVGKTTLAAAYAERRRANYRATWWIRAETEPTMRADLVGLGVQLGWIVGDVAEEPAVNAVLDRLRTEGDGILLIYDNAIGPRDLGKFLPRGGPAHIIITSNAPNWRGIADPVEIEVWPEGIGADFLMVRAGRAGERDTALALSDALGGLPLAHEQAAAYCERVGISFADYLARLETVSGTLLDCETDASSEYHNRRTVAKTFTLALDEVAKAHPAAAWLLRYVALLPPEPIPLYLFYEAREKFSEPLASALARNDLDEAVAMLRLFALIVRENLVDGRDPSVKTACIRLHRLVRLVIKTEGSRAVGEQARRELIVALASVYPAPVFNNPKAWPRARQLDAIAVFLVDTDVPPPQGAEEAAAFLLNELESYRHGALASYEDAQRLSERALAIREQLYGLHHPAVALSLNNIAGLLMAQGCFKLAQPYLERALGIFEAFGANDPVAATVLNNLGYSLHQQGDFRGALPYYERALAVREQSLGEGHADTAGSQNNLGDLLLRLGNVEKAREYCERALKTRKKIFGLDHPDTAQSLESVGLLLWLEGNFELAKSNFEAALAIFDEILGRDHPSSVGSLEKLGLLLYREGSLNESLPYLERVLAIHEKILGSDHLHTRSRANLMAAIFAALGRPHDAAATRERYGVTGSVG